MIRFHQYSSGKTVSRQLPDPVPGSEEAEADFVHGVGQFGRMAQQPEVLEALQSGLITGFGEPGFLIETDSLGKAGHVLSSSLDVVAERCPRIVMTTLADDGAGSRGLHQLQWVKWICTLGIVIFWP
ncbi:MAG: hypothetical protein BWY79_00671 [Actinobacteria bacterium ADurb.Bin444]|nr:MAG: hypothetical protein BWY79_00671 [Actinobacteria bacterium ADurb.Bin444]